MQQLITCADEQGVRMTNSSSGSSGWLRKLVIFDKQLTRADARANQMLDYLDFSSLDIKLQDIKIADAELCFDSGKGVGLNLDVLGVVPVIILEIYDGVGDVGGISRRVKLKAGGLVPDRHGRNSHAIG